MALGTCSKYISKAVRKPALVSVAKMAGMPPKAAVVLWHQRLWCDWINDIVYAQGVNVKTQQVSFTNAEGERVSVDYDLLVGADGVNSKVR